MRGGVGTTGGKETQEERGRRRDGLWDREVSLCVSFCVVIKHFFFYGVARSGRSGMEEGERGPGGERERREEEKEELGCLVIPPLFLSPRPPSPCESVCGNKVLFSTFCIRH